MNQETISLVDYHRLSRPPKFNNKWTERDGLWFQSLKEANRYSELQILERCGMIKNLKLQPEFPLIVNEALICTWRGDFSYYDVRKDEAVVEDCKGCKTPVYKLKKKLFESLYGRKIIET